MPQIFGYFHFLEDKVEALKILFPKLAIAFRPFGDFPNRVGLERAEVFAAGPFPLDEARCFQVGQMFGNRLLRYREWGGDLVDCGWSGGKPIDDGSAGGGGEGGKSAGQLVHNPMGGKL